MAELDATMAKSTKLREAEKEKNAQTVEDAKEANSLAGSSATPVPSAPHEMCWGELNPGGAHIYTYINIHGGVYKPTYCKTCIGLF